MSATPIFYLHVRSRGCTAEIRLNDAPLFTVTAEAATQAFPTVSEWVIAGENVLSVDLHELEDGAQIHVALCEAKIGDVPEPGHELELIVIDWPALPVPVPEEEPEPEPEPPPALPLSLHAVGVASHPWGEWSWQHAPEFDTTPRSTANVVAYVRDLHGALAAGRVDVLIDQSTTKFDEVAPIYDMSITEARQRIQSTWAALTALASWRLAPFDEADIELRLHCDGRLVEPTTLTGEPILRQAQAIDGERWSMQIFIARTNWEFTAGRLTIVR